MDKQSKSKRTVLIVDDTAFNRELLGDILGHDYEILEAANGLEAMDILTHRWTEISLVLLDVVMPQMDGFALLGAMNRNNWLDSVPVIMISADGSPENIDRAYDLGATDYITRPFDERTVRHRAQNTINLYAKQKVMENLVAEQIMEKERSNFQMVEILSNVVEFRNGESGLHVRHVRVITDILLQAVRRRCPQYGLTAAKISVIANASALHDVGKISIDEKILNKPGRLTDEEFEIMKTHTVIGARMLEVTSSSEGGDDTFLPIAHDICRWHHERWDGRGYPDGLKGEEIPISAQVVALADVYDALTATRVYKPAYPPERALAMIMNGECGAFNPLLLDCLKECAHRLERELDLNADSSMSAMEIRRVTSELLARGDLNAPSHTMSLLEIERNRLGFFLGLTEDVLFEYDRETHRLGLSPAGEKALGLTTPMTQADEDRELAALGGTLWAEVHGALETTTSADCDRTFFGTLDLPQGPTRFRLETRTLWEREDAASWCRVVGKLTQSGEKEGERRDA